MLNWNLKFQNHLLCVTYVCLIVALLVQLECIACGHSWFASRDEVSDLTIDASNSKRSVGTAPWATAKFEDVEKKLVSPRESEKNDIFKKTSEAYMPVLDSQKSFGKSRKDENVQASKQVE